MKYFLLFTFLFSISSLAEDPKESDYYKITDIPIPAGITFEVSGIEVLPDRKIAASSRHGDIYVIENAYDDDPSNDKWTLFATGLHEPIGISYYKGWLWCAQRPEVTRMKDTDGDGRADVFECLSDNWGINGNYHEYAFGSKHDKDGYMWVVLCLTGSGGASSDYRGWCVRVNEKGEMLPTTSGIRSPGGIGLNHLGEAFYGDNQGLWNGTSSVKHLKPGSFQGNPTGNKYYSLTKAIGERPADPKSGSRIVLERKNIPNFVPPTANMPHGRIGKSTSGIEYDSSKGKFGPFENQLLVNDQGFSNVARVAYEKINGVYQGMAVELRAGFGSGNVPITMDPQTGSLFVGGTNRGWGSKGRKPGALERVNWTGRMPFEVHSMNITKTGFKVNFTMEVDAKSVESIASSKLSAYTWVYQSGYGSPDVDKIEPKIESIKVAADGKSAEIVLDKVYKGHTYDFQFDGFRSKSGLPLLHRTMYYTVNEVLGEEHIVTPEAAPEKKKKKK